jgi:hypothetical protein
MHLDVVDGGADRVFVDDAPDGHLGLGCNVTGRPREQVVEYADRMPTVEQAVHEMSADEPGTSCDQSVHLMSPPATSTCLREVCVRDATCTITGCLGGLRSR